MNDDKKITEEFVDSLINTLESGSGSTKSGGINSFFASPAWFFVAVFAVLVNIIMVGIVFWQRLRIDYLVNKVIGG